MGASSASVVEFAKAEARRRGHQEVGEEHLLWSLLEMPTASISTLPFQGISRRRLIEHLDATLSALPVMKGYRDGVQDVPLNAGARAAVAAAGVVSIGWRATTGLELVQSPTEIDLARSLFERGSVRAIFELAKRDDSPVRRFHAAVTATAERCRHRNVLLDHALLTLIDDVRFAKALHLTGTAPRELRTRLERLITPTHQSSALASVEALILCASVHADNTGEEVETLDIDQIVVDILRHKAAAPALALVDLSPPDLLFAYVHGVEEQTILPQAGPVEVVFHNDHFTTMEVVVEVLTTVFDHHQDEAQSLMFAIHHRGRATVGVLDAGEAAVRIERARRICRDRLMPLRIVADQGSSPSTADTARLS